MTGRPINKRPTSSVPTEQPLTPTLIPPDEGRPALPRSVAPMSPRLASAPFNSRDHVFEVKWDGIRAQLARDRDGVRFTDRRGGDLLRLVPEMRDARIPEGVVLDGELIVCDHRGRPSYELLAGRLGPRAAKRGRGPIFVAFDLLYEAGRPLLARPLEERRQRLLALGLGDRRVAAPEHLEHDGEPFFDAVEEYGLEGIVAKRRRSPYVPGTRTADWLKYHVTPRADVVIGGLILDERRGALTVLCGWSGPSGLASAGDAYVPAYLGRWLDDATRDFATEASPFATPVALRDGMRWLRPSLVAIVEHAGEEGSELVDARFRTLRLDGDPATATCDTPVELPSVPPRGPAERPRLVVLQSLPFGK
jgi:bifunctional non-homologous end joining protein LigD